MVAPSRYTALSPASQISSPYKAGAKNQANDPCKKSSYDSVMLSALSTADNHFHMDTVSRLSQEVRTTVTTGDIQRLRQEVSEGRYSPDPHAIAARILFLKEE